MNIQLTVTDQITRDLADKAKMLREIKQPALEEFRRLTPQRTGRARRQTTLQGSTIKANYPYAEVLDAGRGVRDGQVRGSTQAREGMTKPWTKWMEAEVNKRLGKK